MLRGLTNAGIGHTGNLQQFIQLASEYGFEAVDTGGEELRQLIHSLGGVETTREWLKAHHIQIGTIGLSVEWRHSKEEFKASLVGLASDAAAALSVGCLTCCTYVLPSTDYPSAHFMALTTRRLRTCAQIIGAYGLSLGLEFVGPHHLRSAWKNPFIWNIEQTLDWISAIGEPNVGLLFDSFHWHTTEGTIDDILRLKPSQIVHVHINDARDVPIEEVLDNDRLYPGEGVINLTAFLQGLQQISYKGVIAQEILTQQPVEGTAEALVKKSALAFDKVYQNAGL